MPQAAGTQFCRLWLAPNAPNLGKSLAVGRIPIYVSVYPASQILSLRTFMPEFARFRLGLAIATFVLAVAPASSNAQPEASADKLTTARLEWQTQLARQDVAIWETDLLSAPRGAGLSVGNFQDPTAVLKELRPVLTSEYDSARNRAVTLAGKARERCEEVQKDWAEVVRQRTGFRQYAEKQQAAYGFDFDSGTPPGFQPNFIDGLLVLWVFATGFVAFRLGRKERRLDIRRAQRAAVAMLLVGLIALPGCGGPPAGADVRPWAVREEADLTAKLTDATEKTKDAEHAASDKWKANLEGWVALVAASGPAGKEKVDEVVRDGETAIRDKLRDAAIQAKLADRLAKDADEQRGKLAEDKAKLDDLVAGSKWRTVAVTAGRVMLALLLFAISISPFWTVRKARNAAIKLAARTCPRCRTLDTLESERVGSPESEESDDDEPLSKYARGKAKAKAKPKPKPKEAKPEEAADEEVQCTKCKLRFRKSYLTVPRFCFPTVGVRSSGKTHMLVTAYDRIVKRTAPTVAAVQPAPSTRDRDTETRFDELRDLILNRRAEAGPNDLVLPNPILIHVKDTDPVSPNSALVNLFDYSGELINPAVDVNLLRQTAVRMDGFMLFLDPTQLYGDGANATLDQQLGMLDDFLANMRTARRIPVGEVIPVPVAVCIPKFDLLLEDNPIGGQCVQYIREMLDNLSPPPKQVTADIIRERSDLVEQMLPLMFPGADIRSIVEGYFGKQVMFFPMSSVSLFEHELGVKDMERRTIAPYGVTEPLIWLLHMHGYCMFRE